MLNKIKIFGEYRYRGGIACRDVACNVSTIITILLILFSININAQVSAIVDLNRKSVYVQQPFRVNITVYTKTWFTAPLEFTNLQIPNAFTIPFDKTHPGVFTIGGKQYPGIQFYYIVFPYKSGKFTLPPLEIIAQSPPEGSSTSRKITIHTQPQEYTVLDLPADLKKNNDWLVAKNVAIHEQWTPSLKKVKVGDVISRTLVIEAFGTLPQFIPDVSEQERVDWAEIYPKTPILSDSRAGGDVSGKSSLTTTYLLTKAGKFTLPSIELAYWSPLSGKINKVSTPEQTIQVAENSNLGILTTLRDSLNVLNKPLTSTAETIKTDFLIFGLKWYQFTGLVLLFILVCFFLWKAGKVIYRKISQKRQAYLKSSRYCYRQLMKSENNPQSFLPALYRWWDSLKQKPSPSIGASLKASDKKEAEADFKNYLTKVYQGENAEDTKLLKEVFKNTK